MARFETAIFPVAGMGTRLLPATKSVPKELLPVFDTPLLQFAIDEALEAGAKRLVFVSHRSKRAIEDYVQDNMKLRESLRASRKIELLRAVERAGVSSRIETHFVYQDEPLGLGHAVACAAEHVRGAPVAVILPDDLILGAPCLKEMAEAHAEGPGGNMIAAMEVPAEEVNRYGIFRPEGPARGQSQPCTGLVEKPDPEEAPSRLAAVGRYLLAPGIFDLLKDQAPGHGGEIQLTDAIERMAQTSGVTAFRFSGTRFDCGQKAGLLAASNHYAAAQEGAIAAE